MMCYFVEPAACRTESYDCFFRCLLVGDPTLIKKLAVELVPDRPFHGQYRSLRGAVDDLLVDLDVDVAFVCLFGAVGVLLDEPSGETENDGLAGVRCVCSVF